MPPIDEHRQIASALRKQLADRMTDAIDTQRRAVEALPKALLRLAFGGSEA